MEIFTIVSRCPHLPSQGPASGGAKQSAVPPHAARQSLAVFQKLLCQVSLVATCPEVVLVAIAPPICELVASRGRRVVMPSGLKTLTTSNIIISNRVVFKETLPKALWTQALSALNNLHILHIRNIRNILNMLQILHD